MRKDEIKVSIVCITYNQSGYIRDALDSFLSQKTTFEYEILVHDDASDDGTAEIIKEYEEKYPDKITAVLQKENQYSKGVKVATTYLYPIVKGKYVAFCEGDDYWVDDLKLQKQFDYMEKHNECSMCMHNGLNVSKDRKTIFYSKPLSKTARKYTTVDAIKGLGIKTVTNSYFFRTEILKKETPEFVKIAPTGDYARVIVNSLYGYIYYMPDTMSAHRCEAKNSLTEQWGNNPEKWYEYIEKQIIMLDCLNKDTEYKYDKVIQQEKIEQRFRTYLNLQDKEKLKQSPYKELVKKLTIKEKIKYKNPFLFKILRKIVHKYRAITVREK